MNSAYVPKPPTIIGGYSQTKKPILKSKRPKEFDGKYNNIILSVKKSTLSVQEIISKQ
jgi:hypothetical protein